MITLYGFGSGFGVEDPSPFVLKIDLYLRMNDIAFESSPGAGNLQKAPKGKLPFIDDDGTVVADSTMIISYLNEKLGYSLDDHLSPEQKAIAHLVTKSIDENAYWCLVHSRWIREDTWPVIKDGFFGSLPFPLKYIVPFVARRGVKSTLIKQGIGKHSDEEIMTIAKDSLQSLSDLLGDKSFFFGDKASSLDTAAFAFLAQMIICKIDNPLNRMAKNYKNLVAYCEKINSLYYAELVL